jgi:Uma2 family endonuclease
MSNEHETDPTKGVPMTSATAAPPATDDMTAAYGVLFKALEGRGTTDWTVAELDALGLDGSLILSPTPIGEHQEVIADIRAALKAHLGKRHKIYPERDLYVNERRFYEPDIMVCRQDWLPPTFGYRPRSVDVALVVEVESPGTARYDRVNKLHAYAEAGIPAYWRVRLRPRLTVVEHRLLDEEARAYETVAEHVGVLRTEFPGPVEIDLDEIDAEISRFSDGES